MRCSAPLSAPSCLSAALALALITVAAADEVHLHDGSIIRGAVQTMSAEGLTIHTDFAGDLTIPTAKVAGLSTDQDLMVALQGGERAAGRLRVQPDGGLTLSGPTFGDASVNMSQLVAVWHPDQPSPLASEEEVAALKKRIEEIEPQWGLKVEFGLNGETGNSERNAFMGRVEATRKTARERMLIYGQGRYAKENGVRSTNEIMGGIDLEVDLTDRLFAFGKIGLEMDEFESLDLRTTATAGLGYFFIREPGHELKGRAGIGYQHESFDDGSTDDDVIAEVGYDYLREIAPWLLFTHGTTWYPTLSDLGDYRLVSETAGEIPLGDSESWKLRVGMRNEYDGLPLEGVDRMDTFYFLNLLYVIK